MLRGEQQEGNVGALTASITHDYLHLLRRGFVHHPVAPWANGSLCRGCLHHTSILFRAPVPGPPPLCPLKPSAVSKRFNISHWWRRCQLFSLGPWIRGWSTAGKALGKNSTILYPSLFVSLCESLRQVQMLKGVNRISFPGWCSRNLHEPHTLFPSGETT